MHYGQKVRITSGFYQGMQGTVIRENKSLGIWYNTNTTYDIGVWFIFTITNILESNLELIK